MINKLETLKDHELVFLIGKLKKIRERKIEIDTMETLIENELVGDPVATKEIVEKYKKEISEIIDELQWYFVDKS